jgi:pimeloyl-ACP methyl ester carboxylesterase
MMRERAPMLALMSLLFPCLALAAGPAASTLDATQSRYAKLDGMRVHYKSLGEGDTALVFIHGWTCNLTFWRTQVPAFEGKVRMILIDLPGHGQSDKPEISYTMDLFARSVDAVLRDAGVEKAVLIGHSMGTPVARQFYRLFPKKTVSLVAVDGPLRPPANMKPAYVDGLVARYSTSRFKESVSKLVDAMFPKQPPAEVRDAVKSAMQSTPPHVAQSAMRAMYEPAIWEESKISIPVQAIMANKRQFGTPEYQKYVRKLCPDADFVVIDGVGHFLMLDKPDVFNKTLAGFLAKQGLLKS